MKQEDSIPKFVIYCRKSTDEWDKQEDSIPSQIKAIIQHHQSNSYKFDLAKRPTNIDLSIFNIDWEIEREYEESPKYKQYIDQVKNNFIVIERCSAKRSWKRKKWKALMKLAKQWKIDWIVAYWPERCSRNMWEAGQLIDYIDHWYLDMQFTNFVFENNANGKMMLAVLFWFAKHYSDNRSELSSRWQKDKWDWWEALGDWKYWYIRNDNDYFEPHKKYFDLMKAAFYAKIYQWKTDKEIANWLDKEWFRIVTRVGKKNKQYWKVKFNETRISYKNLSQVRVDEFYYWILTYWVWESKRYDQRVLNPDYWEPMITKEQYDILVEYSNTKKSRSRQWKGTKEENSLVYPFPIRMVTDKHWNKMNPWLVNRARDIDPKLRKMKIDNENANLWDIVKSHQIKYRCWVTKINTTAEPLIEAASRLLEKLEVHQWHYDIFVKYTRKMRQKNRNKMNSKRQALYMRKWSIESEMTIYIDSVSQSLNLFTGIEMERHHNKLEQFQNDIKDIDREVSNLQEDATKNAINSLQFFEFAKNAKKYFDKWTYVQKRVIAEIFFLNITYIDENSVDIAVNPMLAELFSGMVTDNRFELLTSTMSM